MTLLVNKEGLWCGDEDIRSDVAAEGVSCVWLCRLVAKLDWLQRAV